MKRHTKLSKRAPRKVPKNTKAASRCAKCGHGNRSHRHNAGVEYCETCISKLNQNKWIESEKKRWNSAYHKYKEA